MTGTVRTAIDLGRAPMESDRFFALTQDMLCIVSFDGYFKWLNPAWERTLGFSDVDLLAQPFAAFVHPDDREATVTAAQRLFRGADVGSFENRYRCADGTYKWLQWNCATDVEQRQLYVVVHDVTERRSAVEGARQQAGELAQSNADLAESVVVARHQAGELAQSNADLAESVVVARHQAGELAQSNADLAESVVVARQQAGELAQSVVFAREQAAELARSVEDARQQAGELAQSNADLAESVVVARQQAAELAQSVVFAREQAAELARSNAELAQSNAELAESVIFAREQAAELAQSNAELAQSNADLAESVVVARQQAAELAQSNAELEQFAYVASHDLQEPLRVVASYLQLLERRYKGRLDERADTYISYAVDAAKRMQQLIRDVLAFSRIGRLDSTIAPTDCEGVLEWALANVETSVQGSSAVVTHDPLPTVMADAAQMRQLFQNLLGNALKFCSSEEPRVHLSAERRDGEWLFSCRDNGIGISPEYLERIFLLFQRLHSRSEYPGMGIGLAICKKIVERHGGRIWAEAESGKGSTFFFTIPDPAEGAR